MSTKNMIHGTFANLPKKETFLAKRLDWVQGLNVIPLEVIRASRETLMPPLLQVS